MCTPHIHGYVCVCLHVGAYTCRLCTRVGLQTCGLCMLVSVHTRVVPAHMHV